jgi:hypothetical protein
MSSEEEKKQVDVLLASYKAIKDEIARRSALTWTAVGAYLVFIFSAFKAIVDQNANGNNWEILAWATSTWPIALLTYLFYLRENKEIIDRLSDNIKCDIEKRLRDLLKPPSSNDPLLMEREDRRGVLDGTAKWQAMSDWAVFFGGPLIVTALALWLVRSDCTILHFTWVCVALHSVFGTLLVYLLIQNVEWKRHRSPRGPRSETPSETTNS